MNVASPTQTTVWSRCPRLWELTYLQGWRPRVLTKADLAAVLSTGVHAGLAHWNAGRVDRPVGSAEERASWAVDQGAIAALGEMEYRRSAGQTVADYDRAQADAIPVRVQKAIRGYIANDPVPPEYTILDVECTIPEGGNCRIDLVARDGAGRLVVVDYKVKLSLDKKYLSREMTRWRTSWQMRHYVHFLGAALGEPVSRYEICALVLEPRFSATLYPFPVHRDEMDDWLDSATQTWLDMAADRVACEEDHANTRMAATHEDTFGDCPFKRACFDFKGDAQLMEASGEYVRRAA